MVVVFGAARALLENDGPGRFDEFRDNLRVVFRQKHGPEADEAHLAVLLHERVDRARRRRVDVGGGLPPRRDQRLPHQHLAAVALRVLGVGQVAPDEPGRAREHALPQRGRVLVGSAVIRAALLPAALLEHLAHDLPVLLP